MQLFDQQTVVGNAQCAGDIRDCDAGIGGCGIIQFEFDQVFAGGVAGPYLGNTALFAQPGHQRVGNLTAHFIGVGNHPRFNRRTHRRLLIINLHNETNRLCKFRS